MATARLSFLPTLKGRALRLLSRREHSRRELERKLQPYEEEPGTLAQALDELQARGFISEERVAESVLNRRASRLGATRIRQELQDKGLDGELIARTLSSLKDSELARARQVWQRKFDAQPQTPQERAQQTRFLLARGFAGEVVRRVLGGGPADEEA